MDGTLKGPTPFSSPSTANRRAELTVMESGEQRADSRLDSSRWTVWIIEYVWAHGMMDIQEVVDPSSLPEVESQPLGLEDTWRLHVASTQVYSIVKKRDMERFERVICFLEATYRLLPRLVATIKHMKIMFGLKTMVVMWMLREGRGHHVENQPVLPK